MTTPTAETTKMAPPTPGREPGWTEGIGLAAFCGLAYLVAFYLNMHVLQAESVFAGVALFYLPAGVKLIAIMVARYWGALGLWVANFLHTTQSWEALSMAEVLGMSLVWVGTTLTVVMLWARFVGLRADLKNLTFGRFVWLNLSAALVHGLVFNLYMVMIDHRSMDEWLHSAQAMALGDFVGSGALMLLVLGLYKITRKLRG